jgi:polysaccharide export outer membrane protein
MAKQYGRKLLLVPVLVSWALCLFAAGCNCFGDRYCPRPDVPNELDKIALPDYTISPPDVLLIDAVNLIPKPPYRIAPLDGLLIRVNVLNPREGQRTDELLPDRPINGLYRVEVDGGINLGFDYGTVQIAKLTIAEAKAAIINVLKLRSKLQFDLTVALVESRALQQIRGEHLVSMDGKVTLGMYGSVFVAGLTLADAKHAIEEHLSQYLLEPEIAIDVSGYNSKVYYVIIDQDGIGTQITRLPITGNETVLDALGAINGLPAGVDHKRIFVARRTPADQDCEILPVNFAAVCRGATATNYQLLPGDRVYVSVDRWIAADYFIAKIIAPFERILGVTLLTTSTIESIQSIRAGTGGNGITNP